MRKVTASSTLSVAGAVEASIDIFSSGFVPELIENDCLQAIGNIVGNIKKKTRKGAVVQHKWQAPFGLSKQTNATAHDADMNASCSGLWAASKTTDGRRSGGHGGGIFRALQ
jgi:hypothetical protein